VKNKLLIIDDDRVFCGLLKRYFENEYEVTVFSDPEDAVRYLQTHTIDVVLTDLNMPGLNGMEVLRVVKSESPSTDVIIMTAYAQIENAVEAMKQGAYDYITKPLSTDDLSLQLGNLFHKRRLAEENANLREFVDITYRPETIIGKSKAVTEIRTFIEKVSLTDFPVLISGENGTGKELISRAIHFSGKREGKFLLIHCSEFSQEHLERELFGYEDGAIPYVKGEKIGFLGKAGEGTLVLAEIDEMPLSLQARLLGVIDRRSYRRLGSSTVEDSFCGRVIAITGKDLRELVRESKFREDLFYRLDMFSLKIPPLRERREDIPDLAKYFFSLYREEFGRDTMELSKEAVEVLKQYNWPGNVQELKGLFAKVCLLVVADTINRGHILAKLDFPDLAGEASPSLTEAEKNLIIAALEKTRWNVMKAARDLNISYDTLRYRMKKYDIER
jgi:DNA-binding NtrC family response regulator